MQPKALEVQQPSSAAAAHAPGPRQDLTQGPITRTLLGFALPVLGGNALQALNGGVNQFWVSHSLGVNAVTAIGNANVVTMLMLGAIFGVSMAANILIGQQVGAQNLPQVKRIMGTSVTFFIVLAVFVGVVGYLASPSILALMGTPAEAVQEAEIYLRIVFLAMPFMYFFAFLQMAQRGIGDSRTPFYFMALAVAIDVVLNPLLIRGIGPFPKLAIAGSAVSTLVAQGISLAFLVLLLYRRESPLALRWSERRLLIPERPILKSLIARGLPMGLQMLVMSGAALVMVSLVNSYGAVTAAAFTGAAQVWTYLQLPAMALGAAVSSMAAQNVGAGAWDRVSLVARAAVISGVVVTAILAAVIYGLGDASLRLFLPAHSETVRIAAHINDIVMWGFVFFSVTFVLAGVVRATGAVWAPLLILVVSMYVLRVPFALLLRKTLGAEAIWWSFPLGTVSSALLMTAYYLHGGWKKSRMVDPPHAVGSAADAGLSPPSVLAANSAT